MMEVKTYLTFTPLMPDGYGIVGADVSVDEKDHRCVDAV
jgi:hypothetical protein